MQVPILVHVPVDAQIIDGKVQLLELPRAMEEATEQAISEWLVAEGVKQVKWSEVRFKVEYTITVRPVSLPTG